MSLYNECIFFLSGVENNIAPTHNWPHHPQPLPLALLSQSESRMEAGLLTSLQHASSIQGFPAQQLSGSQLSFSSSVAPPSLPAPERFCHASFLENSGHRAGQRAGLGQGGGLHYDSHIGKWSFSGRKGFNGPAAVEGEGGTVQTIRTQVAVAATFIPILKLKDSHSACHVCSSLLLPPYKRSVWHKILWEPLRCRTQPRRPQETVLRRARNPLSCLYLSTCAESASGGPQVRASAAKAHLRAERTLTPRPPEQTHSSLQDSFHQPSLRELSAIVASSVGPLQYWMDLDQRWSSPFSTKGV